MLRTKMTKTVRTAREIRRENLSKVTISSNSSDDTDIIQSSVIELDSENDLIKRGKVNFHKCKISPCTPLQIQSISSKEMKNSCSTSKETDCLKFSFTKSHGLLEESELLNTPCTGKNSLKEADSIMKKLISTLKKTPEGPYLSKSKLKNIQQWLMENDTETVRTPPFANLSVTPIRSSSKRFSEQKNASVNEEGSSLDSEVEGVLKAVYGDSWKREGIKSGSKTEPKKRTKFFSPVAKASEKKAGGFHSVRRKILNVKRINSVESSDEENKLDNSVLSGIKMINLDGSYSDEEQVKKNTAGCDRKNRKRKAEKKGGAVCLSSLENFLSRAPLPSVQRTPRNSADKKPVSDTPLRTPKKTFLASLSVSTPTSKCHPDAQDYKLNFKSKKDELVKKLYKLYNNEVFEGKLGEELKFSWNVKLRGTAGYCYNKRITKSTGEVIRLSRIEFSTKIVDRADRVRDTMIHELCHAASWMIDGVLDGHGEVWTKWASKAMRRFPELPTIKRCHNYDIVSKYLYKCTGCGYSIKRHSKSINTDRKRCGHCYGVLELLINRKRKGKGEVPEFDTTRTLPTPNKFAMFVKENYHSVKSSKANAKHSEVMKTLSQQYALIKNGTKSAGKLPLD